MPERQRPAIVREHRGGVALLEVDRTTAMRLGHRQPRLAGREAGIRLAAFPDHRRAAAVAALEGRPEADAVRIAQILERDVGFLQPQLFALVKADRAAQRNQQVDREFGDDVGIGARQSPARDVAHHVVVGKGPADPAVDDGLLERAHALPDMSCREFRAEQVECVAHLQFVAARRIGGDRRQRASLVADLAHRHARRHSCRSARGSA